MRVLHFADFHFEKDKIEKCKASADFIIAQAKEIKPDLIINAGDIFNRLQSLNDKSAVSAAKSFIVELASIAPVAMVYGNESHDAAGSYEIFCNLDTTFPIYVSDRAETIMLLKDVDAADDNFVPINMDKIGLVDEARVVIHLFPYPTKQWFFAGKENLSIDESNQLIQSAIKQIFTGFGAISMDAKCPVILVGHGNISGSKLCSGQDLVSQDIMLSKHDLELARADVQCWGHIHECQEVAPHIWYSGSTFHNNWGEVTPRYILLHEVERGSCQTTKIQIPSRALALHELKWDEESGPEPMFWDPEDHCDWEGAELRVRVSAPKEKHALITDAQVESRYRLAHSIKVERIVTPTERVRSADVTKVKTLPDKLTAWAQVTDQKLSPDVLALAGDVERSVTL